MIRAIRERLLALCGRVPGCEWVRIRLGAYYGWDPSLSKGEFLTIERHLDECTACAAEWQEVRHVQDTIERTLAASDPDRITPEAVADSVMARFEASDGKKEARRVARKVAWTSVSVAQLAAACLLVVALPVLAYVAAQVWRGTEHDAPREQGAAVTRTDAGAVTAIARAIDPVLVEKGALISHKGALSNDDVASGIDEQLDRLSIQAEVEMLLPQTEEEYETWARKEYPHIMWLYGILREEFAWDGTWRQLLIDSGEIFRFDWPVQKADLNCQPRKSAVVAACRVAGYHCTLLPGRRSGEGAVCVWPALDWRVEDDLDSHVAFVIDKGTDRIERAEAVERMVRVVRENVDALQKSWCSTDLYRADVIELGGTAVMALRLEYLRISARVVAIHDFDAEVQHLYGAFSRRIERDLVTVLGLSDSAPCAVDLAKLGVFEEFGELQRDVLDALAPGESTS